MAALTALVLGLGALLMVGLGIAWVGFQTLAPEIPAPGGKRRDTGDAPLPTDLPAPVERFFRQVFGGDRVPILETATAWGRARLRHGPLWAPAHFRSTLDPGRSFEHRFDVGWFGRPVVRGYDRLIGSGDAGGRGEVVLRGWLRRRFGGPAVDQAQQLALWAWTLWAPSALVLDPRLCWRSVDEATARLEITPQGRETMILTAHFDPRSGWLRRLEGRRPRGDDPEPRLWRLDLRGWQELDGVQVPAVVLLRWGGEISPYAMAHVQGLAFNLEAEPEAAAEDEDDEGDDRDGATARARRLRL